MDQGPRSSDRLIVVESGGVRGSLRLEGWAQSHHTRTSGDLTSNRTGGPVKCGSHTVPVVTSPVKC